MIDVMTWLITRGAQIAICLSLTVFLIGAIRELIREGL